jgi:hypothetical protein
MLANIRTLLARVTRGNSHSRSGKRRAFPRLIPHNRRCFLECLEDRTLLAGGPYWSQVGETVAVGALAAGVSRSTGNFGATPIIFSGQAPTTTTVTSSPNGSIFGQPVTFSVTVAPVAPATGTPTGTVTFFDSGKPFASAGLSSSTASLTTSSLTVGKHTVTVSYHGDINFGSSISGAMTQSVQKADSMTTIAASLSTTVFGQPITFTTTLSAAAPGAGTPTGIVHFVDIGIKTIATVTLSNGSATLAFSVLSVGVHTLSVTYDGDSNFNASSSALIFITVNKDSTSTTLASSANPSAFGQAVTFTGTASADAPGSGTPGGTFTFLDSGASIGTATLAGGTASFTTSALSVGSHTITIVYSGDANFNASTSAAITQTVTQDSSSTTVASSLNPSMFNQSVTFTATVVSSGPSSATPTGTVAFLDSTATLGVASLAGGTASLTTASLGVGSHTITVSYSGDVTFTASTSAAITQTVNTQNTSTTITSSLNPSTFGQTVTFTATVSASITGSGTPGGTITFLDGAATLGAVGLTGGTASLSTSSLSAGNHTITASYSGDSNFGASTSAAITQTVNQSGSATAVSSAPNPSVFGQAVTFMATVSASGVGAGTPGGTVTFLDSALTLGTTTLSGGTGSFTTSALAVGSHTMTVSYSGDVNFNPSTSAAITQTVNKSNSSTTVSSATNPSAFGQAVTFAATVSASGPGAGTPGGTVTFLDSAATLGVVSLSGGSASLTTSALTVGNHTITASYSGESNFTGSTSAAITQTVNQDSSAPTVTSNVNPSAFGQAVTFTATVSASAPGAGTPGGTVTFLDSTATLGVVSLSGGSASLTTSALTVGNHTITVSYSGDSNFAVSTSTAITQTVSGHAPTTTTVTTSLNPSQLGQAVTFTATVTGAGGTPGGTVTFVDSAATLGVANLSGGTGSFTTASLGVGTHTITVTYSGDSTYNASTSAAVIQTVNKNSSSTALATSVNPSVWGQSVTFSATVTSSGNTTPTGTVTFLDGATTLGVASLNGMAQATLATASLTVATHSISASYSGDASVSGSTSAILSQTVNQASANVVATSSPNPSVFGQSVAFTATVSAMAPGAGLPTGTVTFMDGATSLGSQSLDGSGRATFSTSALSVGIRSITALYGGDADFLGATSTVFSQTVGQAATATSLTTSLNPSTFGQGITFTATVTAVAPGSGTRTGNVAFIDGGMTFGTSALGAGGQASFTATTLSVGTHAITAAYLGDANFTGSSSSAITQTVNKGSTTTGLASSVNPSYTGQTVTFTATVSGSGTTATGTVTFLDGFQTLGTANLNGAGAATVSTSSLSLGTHSITAVYAGDSNYFGSTSAALSQTVTLPPTTTTLTSSLNPSIYTQQVTFTAVVTAANGATPTGQVSFFDGATGMGTVNLDASGTATFSASGLVGGTHLIIANYSGSATLQPSSGSLTQTVGPAGSLSNLTTSTNPAVFGQLVTFSLKVTGGGSPPTGTASFYDGNTLIGTVSLGDPTNPATAGKASISVGPPPGQFMSVGPIFAGTHSISAVYNGSPSYNPSTSNIVMQVVNKDATSVSLTSSLNPSNFGLTVTFTATITPAGPGTGTPSGTVTFKDGNTTVATAMVDSNGNATFTTSSLTVGNHAITAGYSGDANFNASASGALTQTVNPALTMTTLMSSLNPSSFTQTVTFTATVTTAVAGTPTGTVTFKDGAAILGTGTLNGNAQATFTTSALAGGTHSMTAVYGGDPNYAGSSSAGLAQTVNPTSTTTTLISSLNPSALTQAVTFTATVSSAAGSPDGTITFLDAGGTLASSPLNASGQASLTTSSLSGGTHAISAVYAGTGNFAASSSVTLSQSVNPAGTTTTLTDSIQSSQSGMPFTLTATVTASVSGFTPTGTVSFLDGGTTTIGTGTVSSGGVATLTISTLSAGAHTLTAAYSGDANFTGGVSTAITHTVTEFGSTTAVASSLNPSSFGQSVTFTATVTGGGSGTPTGTVTFYDGGTSLGSGTLNAAAQATFTTSALGGGMHSITATYGGDVTFSGSKSPAIIQTVSVGASSTAVASSANPSSFSTAVTLTATVTAVAPAFGTPTGTVTFEDGAATLGMGTLSGGQATFTSSSLSIGNHMITVVYGGDNNFAGSTSAALTQTVTAAVSTTTLVSSANPSVFGQSVVLTATVSGSGAATPTGTITFLDGAATLGTGMLSGGKATLTKSNFTVGSHTLTASYGGDANFMASTSTALAQTVNKASTATALVSSQNPSDSGQSVMFTATVTAGAPGAGTPTGTVTFFDGTKSLSNITLNSQGKAVFTTSGLAVGTRSMTAKYNGDANFSTSVSPVLLQTVNGPLIASGPNLAPTVLTTAVAQTLVDMFQKLPPAAVGFSPAWGNISGLPHTTTNARVRDQLFVLVARGEENELLGIHDLWRLL